MEVSWWNIANTFGAVRFSTDRCIRGKTIRFSHERIVGKLPKWERKCGKFRHRLETFTSFAIKCSRNVVSGLSFRLFGQIKYLLHLGNVLYFNGAAPLLNNTKGTRMEIASRETVVKVCAWWKIHKRHTILLESFCN